jgi:hypothetical protein
MGLYLLKSNFTSGEISPLLDARVDNDRYKNGCKKLLNMHVKTQGPVTRRSGFQFIYDLSSLGLDPTIRPRTIPFVHDEINSYVIILFRHTDGTVRAVFATGTGLVMDSVVPTDPYVFVFSGTMDLTQIHWGQSNDVLYITQPTRMPVELKRLAANNWTANEVSITTPPFIQNKTTTTVGSSGTTGTVTLTASAALFNAGYVGQSIKLNGGVILITTFTDTTHVVGTVKTDLTAATATDQWYSQEFGPVCGYPRFVGFYEQRLFYASTSSRPQTIWFSKSGDYYDFSISSPIVASDGCTFTLDSGSQNKMQWVHAARQLVIGTLGEEWAVSGSGYDPLSFSSIRAARHTNHGGEPLVPIMIGPVILFLERLGRTVNQLVYDFYSDSYTSVDLSILAPHLTDTHTIIDWAYQQTPNGIIWAVRNDGDLLGLTFKREHNVTGWHHHDTQGSFISCACIPGSVENDLWTIVKRRRVVDQEVLLNANYALLDGDQMVMGEFMDFYYLEKKAPEFLSTNVLDSYFLDSYQTYDGAPATVLSGLSHLEGCSVDILGDGAVYRSFEVKEGMVTLPYAVSRAVIGLPYASELVPQMMETDTKAGTSYARIRRIDHIDIDFLNSLGMSYGRYDDEGLEIGTQQAPFRVPSDSTGTAVPLFNGIKRLTMPPGNTFKTNFFVRQDQPLPLTVVALVTELDIKD